MGAKFINYKLIVFLFVIINILLICIDKTRYYYIWFLLTIFLINVISKLVIFIFSLSLSYKKYDNKKLDIIKNEDLPIYSILIPLHKEDFNVIRNLLNAIYNFDYDISKLDITILIEEDDIYTLNNVKLLKNIFKFNYLIVPKSNIKTKPNALNYGLKFVKGKYLVIYDAEDIPEPYQLKKTVYEFDKLPENFFCLQAKLNFYNKNENILTKCFSIEYSIWFNYFMRFFSKYFKFFTIGGTSNHFRVNKLKEMNGWDAYNVTEDAEISIRALKYGYKIKTLNSITLEESVKDLNSWFKQRKRWIKGYIQTYLQHSINSVSFCNKVGFKKFFLFHYLVGSSFIVPIFYLFFLISYIFYFNDFTQNQLLMNKLVYNLYIYSHIITILFLIKKDNKIKIQNIFEAILYIIYSHLYILAVYLTVIELIKKPFIWNKTEHNRSIYN